MCDKTFGADPPVEEPTADPTPKPSKPSRRVSRRSFLQTAGAAAAGLGLTNLTGPFVDAAAAQTGARSLVCIMLNGGADSFSMYVPRDNSTAGQTYGDYRAVRGNDFSVPAAALLGIGDGSFGLNPAMTNMAAMFEQNRMAVVRNVGPLIRPTTKADYAARRNLPQDLFAHDTQQKLWQTGRPTTAISQGWGDSIAAAAANGSTLDPSFSISGSNRWQAGRETSYTKLSPSTRVRPLLGYDASLRSWIPSFAGVETVMSSALAAAADSPSAFEQVAATTMRSSIVATTELEDALIDRIADVGMTDVAGTTLGGQLRRVALLIHNRQMLSQQRQVFFVRLGGWDTHNAQNDRLPLLLGQLDQALGSFYRSLDQLGLSDSVTTFTASDFGRTLTINGTGTDHGWGGHAFVMGGAVNGGHYGTFPDQRVENNPDDTGDRVGNFAGRLIPTTSVGQYGATLASWMGLQGDQLDRAFPELSNFSQRNLGFLS